METLKTQTLIIGTGPAGLATAMELSRANKDFILIEKQTEVGGLAKTYRFKEGNQTFLTDNGPHRFFSKNQYLYDFIEDLINEQWIVVNRQTRQFIDGKFYDYPVNAPQALRNMGFLKAINILTDYAAAKLQYGLFKKPINNFYDYTVANFGKSLGHFNMINYTEKIWGIPASEIHADWARQRIKGLDLTTLLKDATRRIFTSKKNENQVKTLVDQFYYPEQGTGLIYETIAKQIKKRGYKLLLETEPREVRYNGKRFYEVMAKGPKGELRIKFDNLVESVPMKDFISMIRPQVPAEIVKANKKLRYRSQVYLFITLDRPSVSADQWIYFPSKDTPIARISEMRNFSTKMSPAGKTSLFVEFFCFEGDSIWSMPDNKLYHLAADYLEKMGFFMQEEVRKYYVFRQLDAYPIYDTGYKSYLNVLKKYLDSFENLYYIGRPGRFRYNNQDHSLEMGILAAKSLIEKRKYDIEKVGNDDKYFEAWKLKTKAQSKSPVKGQA